MASERTRLAPDSDPRRDRSPDGDTRIVVDGITVEFGPQPRMDGPDGPRRGELLPAPLRGRGPLPGSTVKVWITGVPIPPGWAPGPDSREVGTIRVADDGSFDGTLTLGGRLDQPPTPIGRHVLQIVGFDPDGEQIVIEKTVDVGQRGPRPEIDRTTGTVPTPGAGEVIATVAGLPTAVVTSLDTDERGIGIAGDGWMIGVRVDPTAGRVEPAGDTAGLRVTLSRAGVLTASGTGMLPGFRADVWMFSEEVLLGVVTVAPDGSFVLDVAVDPRTIGAGVHTVQVQGVGTDGYVRAANVAVIVEGPSGLDALPGTRLGLLLLALSGAGGFLLLLLRRRRDEDEEEEAAEGGPVRSVTDPEEDV